MIISYLFDDYTLQDGMNPRSGTEAIFTLIWLVHVFGIGNFACSLMSGLNDDAATLVFECQKNTSWLFG